MILRLAASKVGNEKFVSPATPPVVGESEPRHIPFTRVPERQFVHAKKAEHYEQPGRHSIQTAFEA